MSWYLGFSPKSSIHECELVGDVWSLCFVQDKFPKKTRRTSHGNPLVKLRFGDLCRSPFLRSSGQMESSSFGSCSRVGCQPTTARSDTFMATVRETQSMPSCHELSHSSCSLSSQSLPSRVLRKFDPFAPCFCQEEQQVKGQWTGFKQGGFLIWTRPSRFVFFPVSFRDIPVSSRFARQTLSQESAWIRLQFWRHSMRAISLSDQIAVIDASL